MSLQVVDSENIRENLAESWSLRNGAFNIPMYITHVKTLY